jgi:hypothetical protein
MPELSVLVTSCDKYSHLLPYFTKLFDKYWESKDKYPKYISLESENVSFDGYTTLITGDVNWSNSLQIALKSIDTPYVFLIFDDFFPVRTIPSKSIETAIQIAKARNLDKYVFHYPHVVFNGKLDATNIADNVYQVQQDAEYTMTVQPGIWRTEFLRERLDGENPWEFEINGSTRANKAGHKIYMEVINTGFHQEAMSRGQFTSAYYDILKRENL